MGLGQRLRRWIDPQEAEPSPDTWVLLTVVAFHEGPMLHSAIEGAGIPAVLQEVRMFAGHDAPRQQIMVRYADHPAAAEIVADLGAPLTPVGSGA